MSDLRSRPKGGVPELPLYPDVARQLFKDFTTCGVPMELPEILEGQWEDRLALLIQPIVADLITRKRAVLMKIIYRVDIPENHLGRSIEGLDHEEASVVIARLIVTREKQKVESRRNL